ncbi:hypothetical protein BGX27_007890 [Mortierella sp. AM989]|nr:hypothetical protein BGX27_007890 [Mortierella sp. AM989]
MIHSSFSATAKAAVALLLISITLTCTFSLPIDPTATISLSFFTSNNDPVPNSNATISVYGNNCIQIPPLANSFVSSSNQSVFALYQDDTCQSYLYSVEASLADLHWAKSLMWMNNDSSQSHSPGVQFTDPELAGETQGVDAKRDVIRIAIISLVVVIFILLGMYLCYIDNRRNRKRGYAPEPGNPTGHRAMAEVEGPARSIYKYNSHTRNTSSTASSVTYLPPYASDGYEESEAAKQQQQQHQQYGNVAHPEEARISNTVNEKKSPRYDLPTSRSMSFSNLTNQVGTGAGLDAGSVRQGRNEGFGFGLGCDLEDSWKEDSRRNSAIILRDAVMTSPHSPQMRPSSVISNDFDHIVGRGGIMPKLIKILVSKILDPRYVYIPLFCTTLQEQQQNSLHSTVVK